MDSLQFIELLFSDRTERRQIARNHVLTEIGQVEKNLYFVHSGVICSFYHENGEEQVIRFGYEGSIMNSLPSFFSASPSYLEIRTIRNSEVSIVTRDTFEEFFSQNNEMRIHYIKLLEQLCVQQMEREIDLLSSSPIERIARVRKRSPQLFQEVPLKHNASYLRMTPETLSRMIAKS